MIDHLKTKVIVHLEDELEIFNSTDKGAFTQLGIELSQEFQHYWVTVGTILDFKEMGGPSGKHEVVGIETITYPKTQSESSLFSYDVVIVYIVKRLFQTSGQ